jgi:hypothetical protein
VFAGKRSLFDEAELASSEMFLMMMMWPVLVLNKLKHIEVKENAWQ